MARVALGRTILSAASNNFGGVHMARTSGVSDTLTCFCRHRDDFCAFVRWRLCCAFCGGDPQCWWLLADVQVDVVMLWKHQSVALCLRPCASVCLVDANL